MAEDRGGVAAEDAAAVAAYETALGDFAAKLNVLHIECGSVSYGDLAKASPLLSKAGVHEALAGKRLPSLEALLEFVRVVHARMPLVPEVAAPGPDLPQLLTEWRARWHAVKLLQRQSQGPWKRVRSVVEEILEQARTDAETLRAEARRDAESIRAQAQQEADRIGAGAESAAAGTGTATEHGAEERPAQTQPEPAASGSSRMQAYLDQLGETNRSVEQLLAAGKGLSRGTPSAEDRSVASPGGQHDQLVQRDGAYPSVHRHGPAESVDQIVFRWDSSPAYRAAGLVPAAYSCSYDRAAQLLHRLGPLLMPDSQSREGFSLVRCLLPETGQAVVLSRIPAMDGVGRTSTVTHALVGSSCVLTGQGSVTLPPPASYWLDDLGDVSGQLAQVPGEAVYEQFSEQRSFYATAIAQVRPMLEVLVAQLIRTPDLRLSFLPQQMRGQTLYPAYAPLLIWGVCTMLGPWLGDSALTYSTLGSEDSAALKLVCVPQWTHRPADPVFRLGDDSPKDGARHVAGELVNRFLAAPDRPEALHAVLASCPDPYSIAAVQRTRALEDALAKATD